MGLWIFAAVVAGAVATVMFMFLQQQRGNPLYLAVAPRLL
jgi:hypothetical protein